MNKIFRKSSCWLVAALVLLAPVSFADTVVTLTGVGDGAVFGGVYVDPYTMTVGSQTGVPVICDDWLHEVGIGETWQATVTDLSTAGTTANTLMFGHNQPLYNELAWLGTQLFNNPTNYQTQVEDSFAIWSLTYGQDVLPYTPDVDPLSYMAGYLTGGTSNAMYQDVLNLKTEAALHQNDTFSGWEIITPTTVDPNYGVPQEFLTHVPEPSGVFGMLGAGFAALIGAMRRKRAPAMSK